MAASRSHVPVHTETVIMSALEYFCADHCAPAVDAWLGVMEHLHVKLVKTTVAGRRTCCHVLYEATQGQLRCLDLQEVASVLPLFYSGARSRGQADDVDPMSILTITVQTAVFRCLDPLRFLLRATGPTLLAARGSVPEEVRNRALRRAAAAIHCFTALHEALFSPRVVDVVGNAFAASNDAREAALAEGVDSTVAGARAAAAAAAVFTSSLPASLPDPAFSSWWWPLAHAPSSAIRDVERSEEIMDLFQTHFTLCARVTDLILNAGSFVHGFIAKNYPVPPNSSSSEAAAFAARMAWIGFLQDGMLSMEEGGATAGCIPLSEAHNAHSSLANMSADVPSEEVEWVDKLQAGLSLERTRVALYPDTDQLDVGPQPLWRILLLFDLKIVALRASKEACRAMGAVSDVRMSGADMAVRVEELEAARAAWVKALLDACKPVLSKASLHAYRERLALMVQHAEAQLPPPAIAVALKLPFGGGAAAATLPADHTFTTPTRPAHSSAAAAIAAAAAPAPPSAAKQEAARPATAAKPPPADAAKQTVKAPPLPAPAPHPAPKSSAQEVAPKALSAARTSPGAISHAGAIHISTAAGASAPAPAAGMKLSRAAAAAALSTATQDEAAEEDEDPAPREASKKARFAATTGAGAPARGLKDLIAAAIDRGAAMERSQVPGDDDGMDLEDAEADMAAATQAIDVHDGDVPSSAKKMPMKATAGIPAQLERYTQRQQAPPAPPPAAAPAATGAVTVHARMRDGSELARRNVVDIAAAQAALHKRAQDAGTEVASFVVEQTAVGSPSVKAEVLVDGGVFSRLRKAAASDAPDSASMDLMTSPQQPRVREPKPKPVVPSAADVAAALGKSVATKPTARKRKQQQQEEDVEDVKLFEEEEDGEAVASSRRTSSGSARAPIAREGARVRWSNEEERVLLKAMTKLYPGVKLREMGVSGHPWAVLSTLPLLAERGRSNVNVKDKWRNMCEYWEKNSFYPDE